METAVKDNSFNMEAKCRICSTIFCCTDHRISHERRLHPKELRNILSDISNQHNLNVTVSSVKVRAVNKEETKSLKFLKSTHSPDCTGKREREEVGSPKLQSLKKKKKSVGLLPHLRTARYSPKSPLAIVNNGIILRSPKECLKSPLATIDDGVSTTTCSDITPSPLAKVDDSLIPKTPSQSSLTANGVSLRTPDECLRNLQANVNNEVKHDNTVYFSATNSPAVDNVISSSPFADMISSSPMASLDNSDLVNLTPIEKNSVVEVAVNSVLQEQKSVHVISLRDSDVINKAASDTIDLEVSDIIRPEVSETIYVEDSDVTNLEFSEILDLEESDVMGSRDSEIINLEESTNSELEQTRENHDSMNKQDNVHITENSEMDISSESLKTFKIEVLKTLSRIVKSKNTVSEENHENTNSTSEHRVDSGFQSEMSHTVGGTLSRSQSSELDESLIREFNVSRDISFRVNSSMLAGFGLNTLTSDIEANDRFICFNEKLKNHPHITYERGNNQDLLELDFQNVGLFGQKLDFLSPETTKENESATDISEIADERQQDNIDNSPVEGFGYVNINTKELYIPVKCFDTELSTIYEVSTFALKNETIESTDTLRMNENKNKEHTMINQNKSQMESSMSAADCTELSRIKHETSNTYPSEEASEISTSDDLGQQNYKIKIDDIQPDQTSIVLKCVSSIAEKIVSLLPFKFSMTKTYCDVNLDSYGLHNGEVEEHIRRRDPIREYTTTLEMSRKLIRPIEGRAPYHVPSSLMASVVTLKKQEMLNESLFSEDDL